MSTQLTLDELDLLPLDTRAALDRDGFYIEAGADDTEFGNAEAVVSSVTSQLFEGAAYQVTGYEALEVTVKVQITGVDSAALARGTAELIKVCRRESMKALTYSPPDNVGPQTVFDVLVATWKHEDDDLKEQRVKRVYVLTLHCKPFPRSAEKVAVPAEIANTAATVTLIDDGSSTTNWSTSAKVVARKNLVTNPGVTGFSSTSGWAKGTNATRFGVSSTGRIYAAGSNSSAYIYVNAPRVAVTPGVSYRIYARAGQFDSTTGLRLIYRWYRSSGSQIGSDVTTQFPLMSGASFDVRTLSLTGTAPANAAALGVFLGEIGEGGVYVDALHIETNSTWTGTPFDGGTPDGTTEYAWSSTAKSSISYAYSPAAVTTSGGYIRLTAAREREVSLTRTAAISMGTDPFLVVTGKFGTYTGAQGIPTLSVNGGPTISASQVAGGTDSAAVFQVDQASITSLKFTIPTDTVVGTQTFDINKVERSNTLALGAPTGRAGDFIIASQGTMPAECAMTVANASDLGRMVLLYTRPAALATVHPALRARRIAGPAVTTAPSGISGFSEVLATSQSPAVTWEIDAASLPASSYSLSARLTASSLTAGNGYTLNWRAYMVLDGSTETSVVTGSRTVRAAATTYGNATGERITEISLISLPTMNVLTSGDASAKLRLQMWVTGGGTWNLDEAWLFDVDKGDLSIVEPASPLHRLKITPASADRPVQSYIAEHEPSMGNITARDIGGDVTAWTTHRVDPRDGEVAIYVATLTATPALSANVEYYPRWDVYAAPIDAESGAEA